MRYFFIIIVFSLKINSQSINVNNDFDYSFIRYKILKGEIKSDHSLNIKPLNVNTYYDSIVRSFKTIYSNKKKSIELKSLGIDYFIEYNSNHPYNRNNGSMIPNRGYQHIISPGLYFKLGILDIQIKPEHHYSENKKFDGFWEGHYPVIWAKRYKLWNAIDMPERFGDIRHNSTKIGQSYVKLNWKNMSIGLSNENIWWGPSIRNSIMMSNHAEGFKHFTFNSIKPIKSLIGNFEWQFITGKLESSGYTPPRTDYEYAGTKLYSPKINQLGSTDDWRYLQGFIISYSPKWINGLSFGFIRWTQMYYALIEGKYWWLKGNPSYFPVFQNLFRSNDKFENYEAQTNQAAGIFLRWHWEDSKSEFYFEFHHNDSKQNIRDLILDSDHSRAATIGLQKVFRINNNDFLFNWEWTQMEQNASSLIRNAGSWYEHSFVYHGYTNKGEVLGSSIGPGSNSHYLSVNMMKDMSKTGIAFEVVDNDNDFYHYAFMDAQDYRRYWKDFNLHINYNRNFKNFNLYTNLIYSRSLNYQWELDDYAEPYYHPGRDVNNFHISIKFTYFGNW